MASTAVRLHNRTVRTARIRLAAACELVALRQAERLDLPPRAFRLPAAGWIPRRQYAGHASAGDGRVGIHRSFPI